MYTFKNDLTQIERILLLVVIVLMFHTTRNINLIFYVVTLFSLYGYLYLSFFMNKKRLGLEIKFYPRELFFLFSLFILPIISLINLPLNEFFIGFSRFFVILPFLFFLVIHKELSIGFIKLTLKAFCFFMAASALSVVYQIFQGPLPFLADATFRSGLERYASLAGSLTTMGSVGALAVLILLFDRKWLFSNTFLKYILLLVISSGMLFSMGKASVINLLVCIFLYLLLNFKIQSFIRTLISMISLLIIGLLVYNFFETTVLGSYIDTIINYTLSGEDGKTSEDLINRVTDKPAQVFEYHSIGIIDYITGIGFGAMAGTMGLSHYPMAHNSYVDLLLSSGVFHLIAYLGLNFHVMSKSLFSISLTVQNLIIKKIYVSIVILTLINYIIGAGKFYQPVQGVIILTILFTFDRVCKLTN